MMFQVAKALCVGIAVSFAGVPAWGFDPFDPVPGKETIVLTSRASGSFLGIGVAEVDASRAKALSLSEERGVEITRVEEDSPAAKASLKTGDVVLEYNGQRVEGVAQFKRMVQETPVGREVKLSIARAGSTQSVKVVTAARKDLASKFVDGGAIDFSGFDMPEIRMPDVPGAYMTWRSTAFGIEAEALKSQLAEYFGVKEGVLVRSVAAGSAADKAGLRAGDVIVKVDETRVSSPREITSSIRSARSKKSISLSIVREKRELSLNLTVEDGEAPHATPKRIQ